MIWRAAFLTLGLAVSAEAAPCRQALALGLDISGSVDAREYRLQLDGLVSALTRPKVVRALTGQPETPARLMVYEWSGPEDITPLTPWVTLTSRDALETVVLTLRATKRRETSPGTGLGTAVLAGARYLQTQDCWRRTLDISGDGKSNLGPRPRDVKPQAAAMGVTVNALVIGADDPSIGDARQTEIAELSAYFKAEVIVGPDAFVETALGYEGYADAMETKLLRELDGLILSSN